MRGGWGRQSIQARFKAVNSKINILFVVTFDQIWIHDDNDQQKVSALLKAASSDLGEDVAVSRFTTFALGEGLEKKANNFAEEVAAMTSN